MKKQVMQQSIYKIFNENRGMFPFHENSLTYFGVVYLLHKRIDVAAAILDNLKNVVACESDENLLKQYINESYEKYGNYFELSLITHITLNLATASGNKDNFIILVGRFIDSFNCIDFTDDTIYKECIEYLIEIYNNPAGHRFWSSQPVEVTKLVNSLLRAYGKSSIYNPFSGLSSYAINDNIVDYIGQEINAEAANIARVRLDANGKEADVLRFDIDDTDSTTLVGEDIDKLVEYSEINCIVATPPFGLKCSLPSNNPGYFKSIEEKVITNFLDSERLDTAIFVFAQKSTSDRRLKGIRQRLIKEDIIDLVIELPKKTFPGTAIGTTIWVLSKNRADIGRDHITMIDARNLMVDGKLDYKTIFNVFNDFNSDEELDALTNLLPYLIGVSKEDIEDNDYSFTP